MYQSGGHTKYQSFPCHRRHSCCGPHAHFQIRLPLRPLHILCFKQTGPLRGPRHSRGFPGILPSLANSLPFCLAHLRGHQPGKAPPDTLLLFSPKVMNNLSFFGPPREFICICLLGVILHFLILEFPLPYLIAPESRDCLIISGFLLPLAMLDKW